MLAEAQYQGSFDRSWGGGVGSHGALVGGEGGARGERSMHKPQGDHIPEVTKATELVAGTATLNIYIYISVHLWNKSDMLCSVANYIFRVE